eukprot:gene43931-53711_t
MYIRSLFLTWILHIYTFPGGPKLLDPARPRPSVRSSRSQLITIEHSHRVMLFLASSSRSSAASSSASKPSSSRGGSQDPQELAKEWKRNLQKEMRKIDRDIAGIKREEDRAVKECKRLAKANQLSSARILAKQIAATRKTVERMHTTKAQLNSVSMNLQASASMMKVQGCISKSADIMHSMNQLVSVKEISETMRSMAREMEKSGLIEEIVGDTMESLDDGSLDEVADAEVERIMTELTSGVLHAAGA